MPVPVGGLRAPVTVKACFVGRSGGPWLVIFPFSICFNMYLCICRVVFLGVLRLLLLAVYTFLLV